MKKIILAVFAIGFLMVSCGGGVVPSAIQGKWDMYMSALGMEINKGTYEFTSNTMIDNTLTIYQLQKSGNYVAVSVNGQLITAWESYEIKDGVLTFIGGLLDSKSFQSGAVTVFKRR